MTVRPAPTVLSEAVSTLSGRLANRFATAATVRGTNTVAMIISTPQVLVKSPTEGSLAPGTAGVGIETAKGISRRIAHNQLAPTIASRAARTRGLRAPGSASTP